MEENEEKVELKACPFCSGTPKLSKSIVSRDITSYQVFCKTCGARVKSSSNKTTSLLNWNNRAAEETSDLSHRVLSPASGGRR